MERRTTTNWLRPSQRNQEWVRWMQISIASAYLQCIWSNANDARGVAPDADMDDTFCHALRNCTYSVYFWPERNVPRVVLFLETYAEN